MAQQIPIQRDIGEYQEKIVGKLSLRTLVCLVCGFTNAILAAAVVYFVFGINVGDATLPVMAAALPFWLAGFWRPCGMKFEEFIRLFYRHVFVEKPLLYEPCTAQDQWIGAYPIYGKPSRKARKQAKRKGAELNEFTEQEEQAKRAIRAEQEEQEHLGGQALEISNDCQPRS